MARGGGGACQGGARESPTNFLSQSLRQRLSRDSACFGENVGTWENCSGAFGKFLVFEFFRSFGALFGVGVGGGILSSPHGRPCYEDMPKKSCKSDTFLNVIAQVPMFGKTVICHFTKGMVKQLVGNSRCKKMIPKSPPMFTCFLFVHNVNIIKTSSFFKGKYILDLVFFLQDYPSASRMASAVISSRGSGFNYAFLLLESKEEVEEAVDSFQGGGGSSVLLLPTTKKQVG